MTRKRKTSKKRNPRWPAGWLGVIIAGYWARNKPGIKTITMPLAAIKGKFSKA